MEYSTLSALSHALPCKDLCLQNEEDKHEIFTSKVLHGSQKKYSLQRKLFNRSIHFRDHLKRNPSSYYASEAFMLKEIISESMLQKPKLYSFEYQYHITDKDNIHYADKLYSNNFQTVMNDDGDHFAYMKLDTSKTGKKSARSEERKMDKIVSVISVSNPLNIYLNQILALTRSNYLYHFHSENGQLIYEQKIPLILFIGNSSQSDVSSTNAACIRNNVHFETIYFVSNLKNRSAIQVTILEFTNKSYSFALKAKFLLKKSVFGKKLSTVSLHSNLLFLGYSNDEVKIFNLDELIQNFSIHVLNGSLLDVGYYGLKNPLPITLEIDPNTHPLILTNMSYSIPKSIMYPLFAGMKCDAKEGNGLLELSTKGFCKVIAKTEYIYHDVSVPYCLTTLRKHQSDGNLEFELWKLKTNHFLSMNNFDRYCLDKIKDEQQYLIFKDTTPQEGTLSFTPLSPCIIVDRHDRILMMHPQFIRCVSVNRETNSLVFNYEITVDSLKEMTRQSLWTSNASIGQYKARQAKKNVTYYAYDFLSVDYDSETDLTVALLSNGDIFLIENSKGSVLMHFNLCDVLPKKVLREVWYQTPSYEITIMLAYDKIMLEYQIEERKVVCLCLSLKYRH
ncbi:hypothetical protein FDP41_013205 [Naegleria fowleri]|uniref:Uncharacterized protein n=1 Tax=Naegleria fowleri TaxID=5763 RepID=A0A6A5C1S8_NAEFO|nr:uncharacterized protein FDP41_013205 [Naegleria fowleri]KAF0980722.1 hypothetical protein FDP41_013205 [Naegleria fowleri]